MHCIVDFKCVRTFCVAHTGNLWFVWPIDCSVQHQIFQSINFPLHAPQNVQTHLKISCCSLVTVILHVGVLQSSSVEVSKSEVILPVSLV